MKYNNNAQGYNFNPRNETNMRTMAWLYRELLNQNIKAATTKCPACDEVYYITAYKETKGIFGFFKSKLPVIHFRVGQDFCTMSRFGFDMNS